MSPAKADSSSRSKGKKVATNDLPIETMGGEDPYSELDHFEEEEGVCDPGSECPPLINPWYDTHIHFPMVPGDYLPLLSSRMWLSICCRDTEVSWAPFASSIPDLDNCQGTSLLVSILFKSGSSTSLGWKEWMDTGMDTELFDVGFMAALQQAGVLKAIISSRYFSSY